MTHLHREREEVHRLQELLGNATLRATPLIGLLRECVERMQHDTLCERRTVKWSSLPVENPSCYCGLNLLRQRIIKAVL